MKTGILEVLLLLVGIALAVVAGIFGAANASSGFRAPATSTYAQAGAALGFAMASGFIFLSLGIVHRGKGG